TNAPPVLEGLSDDRRGPPGTFAPGHHVGDVDRRFLLDDAALLIRGGGTGMPLDAVDALDEDAVLVAVHGEDLAALSVVAHVTGDDLHDIAFVDVHDWNPQTISGASDTMRRKPFSRSSRGTGPKMRVPRGS